ncbi:CLUMA_CG005721, isoform A [Clunio marinus]|uniref:CLUMA_CG005721, isoform A n=1 Tax=Clunio marinus TaxID=568069 RepID=A0A1J1HXB9_9DIPT|nr:CLUMA_CG005721, isoform A [Clunio marinus]
MANYCRLCLKESDTISIYTYKNSYSVAYWITAIIPELIFGNNDPLSKEICLECLDIIMKANELKNQSIANDAQMREKYEKVAWESEWIEMCNIKKEEDISDFPPSLKSENSVCFEATVRLEKLNVKNVPKKRMEFRARCKSGKESSTNGKRIRTYKRKEFIIDRRAPRAPIIKDLSKIKDKSLKKRAVRYAECNKCEEKFDSWEELDLHSFIHCDYVEEYQEPGARIWKCCLCVFKTISGQEDLHEHLYIHKKEFESDDIVICNRCSYIFKDFDDSISHIDGHNMPITHRCLKCMKMFPFGKKLLRHLQRYSFYRYCDYCGYSAMDKTELQDHILAVHFHKYSYLCQLCGFEASTNQSLGCHMRSKHTEKKFKCAICPRAFVNSTSYRIHQSSHNNKYNYECLTCYRKFKTSSSLVRHNRLHKPEKLEEIKKKYGCEYCGKQFLGSYALNRHIYTHTGVKPFVCSFDGCGKAFPEKYKLEMHIKAHNGELLYRCRFEGCQEVFKSRSQYKVHKETHPTQDIIIETFELI